MAAKPQHKQAYRKMCGMLRTMRSDAGLTQRALGRLLKMHNTMVHRSEIGDRRIDPVEFAAWCRACGADPGEAIQELG